MPVNVEILVTLGGDGTHIGVWARSLYRSHFADRSALLEDQKSLWTYQRRNRKLQSGFGELLTQGIGSADLRVRLMSEGIDHQRMALDVPWVEPTNKVAERAVRPDGCPAWTSWTR